MYGGPVQSVSCLAENQAKHGGTVTVYTTNTNGARLLEVPLDSGTDVNGVDVFYFSLTGKFPAFFSFGLFRKIWASIQNFDVVHIHCWWNVTSVFALIICVLKGRNTILSPHGMLSPFTFSNRKVWIKRIFHKFIGRPLLKKSILHVISKQEETEILALLPTARFFSIPILLDLPAAGEFRKINSIDTPVFSMIFMSRIHPKKGLENLFSVLRQVDFPWHLQIAGSGGDRYVSRLKDLSTTMGIQENITWIGWVDGIERFQLLADADLMVLLSENENFANVVLESLAVGTPVLISEHIGLKDFVIDNGLGWVVSLQHAEIRNILTKVVRENGLCTSIRSKAPTLVEASFSHKMLLEKYFKAYRNASISPLA